MLELATVQHARVLGRPGPELTHLRDLVRGVDGVRVAVRPGDLLAQRRLALSVVRDQVAREDRDARAIYAADKIAKVRELRAKATQDPRVLNGRKLEHYRASLETLRGCADGLALVDQLEFELWALDVLPPSQLDNGRFTDR